MSPLEGIEAVGLVEQDNEGCPGDAEDDGSQFDGGEDASDGAHGVGVGGFDEPFRGDLVHGFFLQTCYDLVFFVIKCCLVRGLQNVDMVRSWRGILG